ncbi:MAG TPA: hypothetical protein VFU73_00095 [Actinocrinis sp.]|nr:hypothetical protein [Actinocrinis sp.]
MDREVPIEVSSTQVMCKTCAHGRPQIRIRRISISQIRDGWTVNGAGSTRVRKDWCPNCGAVCEVILTRLPIELAGVPCPTCGKATDFDYDLNCVETDDGAFNFTATVRCPSCTPLTFTRRVVASLRRIKHLKLGPTGIEIDVDLE